MRLNSLILALFSYLIDNIFGEFKRVKHPVIIIGELITWFERVFYKDSMLRGLFLLMSIIMISSAVSFLLVYLLSYLPNALGLLLGGVIGSMFIAHKMLRDVVYDLVNADNPREKLAMLVSRDTKNLSHSDVCKGGIETYAENLSDGVVAPLMYLVLFGLPGVIVYKAINTLDSMVGYRTAKFENYGKASALCDDIVNYIPARITAILIMLVSKPLKLLGFYKDGKKHSSPNAGMPITAMALAVDIKLGGPTVYFGKLQDKAFFGSGRGVLEKSDIVEVLKIGKKVDIFLILLLIISYFVVQNV